MTDTFADQIEVAKRRCIEALPTVPEPVTIYAQQAMIDFGVSQGLLRPDYNWVAYKTDGGPSLQSVESRSVRPAQANPCVRRTSWLAAPITEEEVPLLTFITTTDTAIQ